MSICRWRRRRAVSEPEALRQQIRRTEPAAPSTAESIDTVAPATQASHPQLLFPTPIPDAPPVATTRAAPVAVTPTVSAVVPPPKPIQLATDLSPPATSGAGLRDPVVTVSIPANQLGDPRSVGEFRILLPGCTRSYIYKQPDLAGTLTVENSPKGTLREVVSWRDAGGQTPPLEIALFSFEPPKAGVPAARLSITWRTGVLVRRPEVAVVARAALQASEMILCDARGLRPQPMSFKPPPVIPVDLTRVTAFPELSAIPAGLVLRAERELPAGWTLTWKAEGSPHSTGPAAESDVGALSFERPGDSVGTVSKVTLKIGSGWNSLTSNWAEQMVSAKMAAGRTQADLAAADQEVARLRQLEQQILEPLEKELADAHALVKLTDAVLAERGLTRPQARNKVVAAREALASIRTPAAVGIKEAVARARRRRGVEYGGIGQRGRIGEVARYRYCGGASG